MRMRPATWEPIKMIECGHLALSPRSCDLLLCKERPIGLAVLVASEGVFVRSRVANAFVLLGGGRLGDDPGTRSSVGDGTRDTGA
jgi:hypothetical protein